MPLCFAAADAVACLCARVSAVRARSKSNLFKLTHGEFVSPEHLEVSRAAFAALPFARTAWQWLVATTAAFAAIVAVSCLAALHLTAAHPTSRFVSCCCTQGVFVQSQLVRQICVYGDITRSCLVAIVVVNVEALTKKGADLSIFLADFLQLFDRFACILLARLLLAPSAFLAAWLTLLLLIRVFDWRTLSAVLISPSGCFRTLTDHRT